jgi:hypothetical protein
MIRRIDKLLDRFAPITNMPDRVDYSWCIATQKEMETFLDHAEAAGIDVSRDAERPIYFLASIGFADLRQSLSGPLHVPNEHLTALREFLARRSSPKGRAR